MIISIHWWHYQVGEEWEGREESGEQTLHHYIYIVIISNTTGGHLKIMTFVTG